MVQTLQQTTEYPQLLHVSGGRCPCCAGRACHAVLTALVCTWLAATDSHAAPNSDGMGKVFGLHTIVLGENGASGVAATELHAAPISDGMGDFYELHGKSNSYDAFRLLEFGGHGGAASVRGNTGSIAFSVFGDVRFGFLMGLRVPYLIRSQEVCMSRRGLVHKEVSLRRFPRSKNMELGTLPCPLPLFILISILCYLGQAVKLEGTWGGHSWRKPTGLGCGVQIRLVYGCFVVASKVRIFFLSLPYLVTGLGRGRTTQRGRSQGIPRARVHMRMGMAQLSGHTRECGVGYCSRGCGGLSLP